LAVPSTGFDIFRYLLLVIGESSLLAARRSFCPSVRLRDLMPVIDPLSFRLARIYSTKLELRDFIFLTFSLSPSKLFHIPFDSQLSLFSEVPSTTIRFHAIFRDADCLKSALTELRIGHQPIGERALC
jgi:hypothetical protein